MINEQPNQLDESEAEEHVLPPDPGLSVFVNKNGTISIRQSDFHDQEEAIITVSAERVGRLVEFLERCKREIEAAG